MSRSYRPVYHAGVPSGWANDPNGTICYGGRAHLFYQHYPYKSAWGTMHWGHFATEDFVRWENLPVALRPDRDYETICGCCSGSAAEKDGKLYLLYTCAQPDLQRQCLAWSEDGGVTFVKDADNPILTADMLDDEVFHEDFRDPRIFQKGDAYYMVAGIRLLSPEEIAAGANERKPKPDGEVDAEPRSPSAGEASGAEGTGKPGYGNLLLARSRDLKHWEYVGHMLDPQPEYDDAFYHLDGVYECPDYFELDGAEVLLSSPQNLPQMGRRYQNIHSGLYMFGKLDFGTGRFDVRRIGELDAGFDFYAAQTLDTPDGRRILIAWKERWDRSFPTQAEGWAGTYTLPRELSVEDGALIQRPVRELASFRQNRVLCAQLDVDAGEAAIDGVSGNVMELRFTLEPGTAAKAGVKLFCGTAHETLIYYDRAERALVFDRSRSGIQLTGREDDVNRRYCELGEPESVELALYLDVSSLEVFVDGGRRTMTGNVYPDAEDVGVRFFAEGGACRFRGVEKYDIIV